MSDHSDTVHRHARWILEISERCGRGHRVWGSSGGDRLEAIAHYGGDPCRMRIVWPRTRRASAVILTGLLHDRLVAEAVGEAVESAQRSEHEADALVVTLLEAQVRAADRWPRRIDIALELQRAIDLIDPIDCDESPRDLTPRRCCDTCLHRDDPSGHTCTIFNRNHWENRVEIVDEEE